MRIPRLSSTLSGRSFGLRWLRSRKILPRSLFGRFAMIIVLPTVLTQLMAVYIFYDRHWSSVTRNMAASLAGEVAMLAREYQDSPRRDHADIERRAKKYLSLIPKYKHKVPLSDRPSEDSIYFQQLAASLTEKMPYPFVLYPHENGDDLMIEVSLPKGLLLVTASGKRITNPSTYIFIMWMTGSAFILLLVSIRFLRGQTRSVIRLAEAAEKFGRGIDDPEFKPKGALEVRRAGFAFIAMRERIKRLLQRRTEMLAGVSHDLKTRLARMKLETAMLKDKKLADAFSHDIREMEEIIQSYLLFAREGVEEEAKSVSFLSLMRDLLSSYRDAGDRLTFHAPESDITLTLKPTQFKRAIMNVVDNGLRYADKIEISIKDKRKAIVILCDDDGPGIPASHYEEVFQPFVRLEQSRNTDTGGTGLGLSITRDIIHSHGGDIGLEQSPLGGLRVVIRLPKM